MSGFAQLPTKAFKEGLDWLARDLRSGAWDRQFGELRTQETIDAGYRLLIANASTGPIR
jgi:hypothetical protein